MSGCRKVRYHKKAHAKRARRDMGGKEALRPYRCPEAACEGFWHLGHLSEVVRRGALGRSEFYGGARGAS